MVSLRLNDYYNSNKRLGNAATTYSDSEFWLPVELLILIASYIRWRGDFLSLCKVSKRFRTVYTPFIYRIVNLYPDVTRDNLAIHLSLYLNLQNFHLSEFVTEFRVTLVDDHICAACVTSTGVWFTSVRKCSCEGYNRALGKALISMKNLRTLAIHCRLCLLKHSHDYLHHLETRTLTEFQFQCLRSVVSLKSTPPTSSILLAPCMRSVTGLALECDYNGLSGKTGGYDRINKKGEVLANLRILSHDGGGFCADLLVTRPIERLCVPGRRLAPLHDSISHSPGRLSHLFMINLVEFLRPVLAIDVAPYRHLTFVGTITLRRGDVRSFFGWLRWWPNLISLRNTPPHIRWRY
jgi:F-box-like